jgi:hypothetical protein
MISLLSIEHSKRHRLLGVDTGVDVGVPYFFFTLSVNARSIATVIAGLSVLLSLSAIDVVLVLGEGDSGMLRDVPKPLVGAVLRRSGVVVTAEAVEATPSSVRWRFDELGELRVRSEPDVRQSCIYIPSC